jgi:hypothetical protein
MGFAYDPEMIRQTVGSDSQSRDGGELWPKLKDWCGNPYEAISCQPANLKPTMR